MVTTKTLSSLSDWYRYRRRRRLCGPADVIIQARSNPANSQESKFSATRSRGGREAGREYILQCLSGVFAVGLCCLESVDLISSNASRSVMRGHIQQHKCADDAMHAGGYAHTHAPPSTLARPQHQAGSSHTPLNRPPTIQTTGDPNSSINRRRPTDHRRAKEAMRPSLLPLPLPAQEQQPQQPQQPRGRRRRALLSHRHPAPLLLLVLLLALAVPAPAGAVGWPFGWLSGQGRQEQGPGQQQQQGVSTGGGVVEAAACEAALLKGGEAVAGVGNTAEERVLSGGEGKQSHHMATFQARRKHSAELEGACGLGWVGLGGGVWWGLVG